MLPQVELWLNRLDLANAAFKKAAVPLDGFLSDGCDVGGQLASRYLKSFLDLASSLREFASREILLRDLQRGLIDFPSFAAGREVFLSWKRGEPDVEHWQDLDAGSTGPITV